ncbi:hypothetical protein [Rhizobium mesoamericanum]|nr:hypothetical protein [Rhizobium mesoamericanum]
MKSMLADDHEYLVGDDLLLVSGDGESGAGAVSSPDIDKDQRRASDLP